MQTKLSTKGQVVLPGPIRRQLGLCAGDPLEARVDSGKIVLTPKRNRASRARITTDSVTGLPVLKAGPKANLLTSGQVREILSTFP